MLNSDKCVVFLCNTSQLNRERKGYFKAFSIKIKTFCVENCNCKPLNQLLSDDLNPILILHPESPTPFLPVGLNESQVPTACFQIDTFSGTEKRIKWSMLFDYAFVFHPKFDANFQKSGHPRAVCLPHAVESDLFNGSELDRVYEVGWVGNLQSNGYDRRRAIIEQLKFHFKMNDVYKYYNTEEMSTVYKQSKIVVNISRDDYPQDANLRCFEVMAGGALLVTKKPTELEELGFIEGTHYVTYIKDTEINSLVQFYLEHEEQRLTISEKARTLILDNHTYDNRVKTILDLIAQDNGQLFAPSRHWDKVKVHETYFHYFAKHLMIDSALMEFREISNISRPNSWKSIFLIIKAFVRALQLSL